MDTRARPGLLRRTMLIIAEVLLVLLTLAIIAAILVPVFYGTSPDAASRDHFGLPARRP